LRNDREQATLFLSQARFALSSGPVPPAGYRVAVGIQEERLRDIERFDGRVPAEYIKEKYIDELSRRDVVWNALCQILDRFVSMAMESRRDSHEFETFKWANLMVDEFRSSLPLRKAEAEGYERSPASRERFGDASREAEEFWLRHAEISQARFKEESWRRHAETSQAGFENDEREMLHSQRPDYRLRISVVGGSCCGFERHRQGTREELAELMDRYLRLRELFSSAAFA
jgi:hypothetical protein